MMQGDTSPESTTFLLHGTNWSHSCGCYRMWHQCGLNLWLAMHRQWAWWHVTSVL